VKSIYIKIGITISITIIVLVWGVNFLKGKGLFETQDYYYVVYEKIDGLAVSSPVLINGYKVGRVSNIHFKPDYSGQLIVEFAVDKEFKIPRPATAQIFSSDLMGNKAINLIYGDEAGFQVSGDTLISAFEGSLSELVSMQMLPLKNKAEDLMKEMEDAIAIVTYVFNDTTKQNLIKSLQHMSMTFKNLESSTSNLDSIVYGGKSKIEKVLANIESITTNLEANNRQISNIIRNVSTISDSLARSNVKSMMNDMALLMSQLNTSMEKINSGVGTIGMLVNNDSLYKNLEDVSYSLNRLLEDLRMNPKRYVHFSMFDTGKTIVVSNDLEEGKRKDKVEYTILIITSNKSIPIKPENFKGYRNVQEQMHQGIYYYTYGSRKNIDKARELLRDVISDFPDAQILQITEGDIKEVW